MKKRLFALVLAVISVSALSACGGSPDSSAENTMGKKDSPVPVGTSVELSYFDEGTIDFKISEAYVGEEAITKAATLDEHGLNKFDPVDGKQYILIHYDIVAKELKGDTLNFNYLYLSAWANNVRGETQLLYGDVNTSVIMAGGSTSGWGMFLVDASDDNPLIELQLDIYKDGERCWFSVK